MLARPAQVLCGTLYASELGAGSQISAVQSFLAHHQNRVGLVTIDIGANDLDHCYLTSHVDTTCLESSDVAAVRNLDRILTLVSAAVHRYDPGARIAAMNYYDPFLAFEFSPGGIKGDELAVGSIAATNGFNAELTAAFHRFGVITVDVATAFRVNDVAQLVRFAGKTVPADVATTCRLTWMCPTLKGKPADIHPDSAGYGLIATTFEKRLAS